MVRLLRHSPFFCTLTLVVPLAVLCQLAICGQSSGSIVSQLSLEELVRQADIIVLGTCVEKKSDWDIERKRILTDIAIASERCFKENECPPLIRIRQEGGTADGVTMTVTGAPQFELQERVIVFLEKTPSSYYRVIGMAQGKFTILQGTEADKPQVTRDLRMLMLLRKTDKGTLIEEHNEPGKKVDLDTFISEIESYL